MHNCVWKLLYYRHAPLRTYMYFPLQGQVATGRCMHALDNDSSMLPNLQASSPESGRYC